MGKLMALALVRYGGSGLVPTRSDGATTATETGYVREAED
jgi:hypothetical protein